MKNDIVRISHEAQSMRERIKDNKEKIKVNKTLPYLVSNVIEVSRFQKNVTLLSVRSSSILIHKAKRTKERTSIWMLNGRVNAQ